MFILYIYSLAVMPKEMNREKRQTEKRGVLAQATMLRLIYFDIFAKPSAIA